MPWTRQIHVTCSECGAQEASEPGCSFGAFQHDLESKHWWFDYEMVEDEEEEEGPCDVLCPDCNEKQDRIDEVWREAYAAFWAVVDAASETRLKGADMMKRAAIRSHNVTRLRDVTLEAVKQVFAKGGVT